MKIRELFCDEQRWTKGWNARNGNYTPVSYNDSAACCWCLMGAIYLCSSTNKSVDTTLELIRKELGLAPRWANADITSWNDSKDRSFQDVKALVDKLDI